MTGRPLAVAGAWPALLRQPFALRRLERGVLASLLGGALILALLDLREDQRGGGPDDREDHDGAECNLSPRRRGNDGVARRRPDPQPCPDPLGKGEPWRPFGQEPSASPACSARTSATVFLPRPSGPCTFQRESARAGQTSQISTPTALSRRPAARPGFSP